MKNKLLILAVLILLFVCFANAQTFTFSEARGSGTNNEGSFAKWEFDARIGKIEIKDNGKGIRRNDTKKSENFVLPIASDEILTRAVFFTETGKDLILQYEVSAGGYGSAYVVRLNGMNLKLKWKAVVPSFNIGKGLIENNSAYLTGNGFAGKLDLFTGKYVWQHDDLYRKYKKDGAFNFFEIPEVKGNTVIFTEKLENNSENYLIFNKTTGKVIKYVVN